MRETLRRFNSPIVMVILLVALAGCGPSTQSTSPAVESGRPAAPKRLTIAMMGDPDLIIAGYQSAHQILGHPDLTDLIGRGFSMKNGDGALVAQIAEQVPSIENGLWKLFLDGTMETTWKIRGDAKWHDGVPVTSADFVLSSKVVRDPELPTEPIPGYSVMDT